MADHSLRADQPPTTEPSSSSANTASQSIPSHPAPADAAATSSGVTADAQHPESVPTRQSDSDRGMRNTSAWKPRFDRRQSWNKEDQKHDLQMTGLQDVKSGPGFSENK